MTRLRFLAANKRFAGLATFASFVAALLFMGGSAAAAPCTPPATDYGTATYSTLNIPSTGIYEIQSRLKAAEASSAANSFLLEIDGNTCLIVGDNTAISQSAWTWVDYRDGSTTTKATHNFTTTGNHTIKLIGREPGVKVDRVIFTQDANCVPSGTGDNCASPPDNVSPVVSLTAPANNAQVSGKTTTISATATDDTAVARVDFFLDNQTTPLFSDTTFPYSYVWDTELIANGQHTIRARATDTAGNIANSSTITVNVNNVQVSCDDFNGVICEDFSEGVSNFTTVGGTWSVSLGKYRLTGPNTVATAVGYNNRAILNSPSASGNFTASVEGNPNAQTNSVFADIGLIFNYQNASNYYYASLSQTNDDSIGGIFKVVNGVQTRIAATTATIQPNVNYTLRVERQGTAIRMYMDNTQVASGNDSQFTSGLVGVGTRSNGAVYDNLRVGTDDDTDPSVSITSPGNNTTVSNGSIAISASASDNVGVTRVEFFRGNNLIGSADTTSPYGVTLNTAALPNGTYPLTARAYDAAGNSATSAAVNIVVNNQTTPPPDTTAPAVTLAQPVNGATVSSNVTMNATATDNVGVTRVEFLVNNQVVNNDTSAPFSFVWNSTTVANGSHGIRARAYDAAGNSTLSSVATVTVSNQAADRSEDINRDGEIDILDLSLLIENFGRTGSATGRSDINGDGRVDILDLSLLIDEFGR